VLVVKSTGIVKRIDDLGRIVLPIELRKILDISSGNSLEIFMEGNTTVLRKYDPQCVFCGQAWSITTYKSKNVCKNCIEEISARAMESVENIDKPSEKAI
jgi:AbrB family transcriptional regulator, transcriptional pleiotropic regulator of transition state genes